VSELEKLRLSYRPQQIATLFVGESPPHNGTFFYKGDSRLFRELKKVFGDSVGFLSEFKAKGLFLDDLVLYPINHMEKAERKAHRWKGVPSVAQRMKSYQPSTVVALMCAIKPMVVEAMRRAGLSRIPLYVMPFPAQGNQVRFRTKMAEVVRTIPNKESPIEDAQQFLSKLHLPAEDNHALVPSSKHFKDGGDYRFEIPSVEGPRVFREVLEAAKELKVPVHRVSQGSGIMLLTKDEIREMARIGAAERIEVCLFVGPRAPFETGAQALSAAGKVIGLQHRGADQLVYAIEDVRKACDLGIRSVLPADLGLIWVLNEMKKSGDLPPNLIIKSSVTLPAANPATARLFEGAGVSTLNIPTDLTPAQMGSIRQAVDIPIDLYIEVPDNFGGFIRYYEMPQILRVAAPVYFKFGLRNAPDIYPSGKHIEDLAAKMGRERVHRARIALDMIEQYAPEAKMSPLGSNDLGIPEV
jgi:hypothetical protein